MTPSVLLHRIDLPRRGVRDVQHLLGIARADTRRTRAITASVTASSPAIEAVCDFAALVPSSLRPTFCMTTGFFAARGGFQRGDQAGRLANAFGVDGDHVDLGIFRQPADAFAHRDVGLVAGHHA